MECDCYYHNYSFDRSFVVAVDTVDTAAVDVAVGTTNTVVIDNTDVVDSAAIATAAGIVGMMIVFDVKNF